MYQKYKSMIAKVYFLLIFTVAVLYIDDRYANISEAKANVVMVFAGGAAVAYGIVAFCEIISKSKVEKEKWCVSPLDLAVLSFGIANVISYLVSGYKAEAFLGASNWRMGVLPIVLLCSSYFILAWAFEYEHNLWLAAMAVGSIVGVWTILNFCGVDPFGLHKGMVSKKLNYVASIGNVNWYAGYLSMLIVLISHFLPFAKKTASKVIYFIFLTISYTCVFLIHSDSVYLGIGAGLMIESILLLYHPERIKAFLYQGILMAVAARIVLLLPEKNIKIIDGISAKILFGNGYLIIGGIALLLLFLFRKKENIKVAKAVKVGWISILCIGCLVGIIYTFDSFSDQWGTNRGYIWSLAYSYFSDFTWKEKLFGVGPDCVVLLLSNEVVAGSYISGVHNEYLQNLLSVGIIGMISYIGIFCAVITEAIQIREWSEERVAVFLAIIAYMAQALVNNAWGLTIAILFILLGVFRRTYKRKI